MSTFELIKNLRSFRSGTNATVKREQLGRVLEAGRFAPSPGNVQSVEFVIVESEEGKESLADCSGDHRVEEAGAAVVIVSDVERMRRRAGEKSESLCVAEASCVAQNMRLVAEEEGLYSCWITGLDTDRASQILRIPDGKIPEGLVLLSVDGQRNKEERKFGMNEIAFYEEYGNQIESQFDELHWKGLTPGRRERRNRTDSLFKRIKDALS